MAVDIPSTKELTAQNLANYEEKINQESPLNDRAFLRASAQNEGGAFTILYKYGQDRSIQNLALTATGEDLDRIGGEYKLPRNPATASEFVITLPATTGTIIPTTAIFTGTNNGVKYRNLASATAVLDLATMSVKSTEIGIIGNLVIGDTMKIQVQIPGAETLATITAQNIVGAEAESDDSYRLRILERIQNPPQGGATTDYRIWAKTVSGVKNAYPYAGLNYPGDITVYVEAVIDIFPPDGIPNQALLDQVEDAILYDPEDGLRRRMPLGVSNLFVLPISRTSLYTTITGLVVENEATVKDSIDLAITNYQLTLEPYIQGLTLTQGRNDKITQPSLSSIVNDVVQAAGGSVLNVVFGLAPGGIVSEYIVTGGDLAKNGGVAYA